MFEINEIVIHKSSGACKVKSIVPRDFGNGPRDYYCFVPVFPSVVNTNLEIYLPCDNAELFVRKPLSKDEVLLLIKSIPSMEKIWFNNAKERKAKFEEIYHNRDMKGLCQLVKLLYLDKEFFSKPMSLTDKTFLLRIKTNIFDEFAVALGVEPSDVETYVANLIKSE